LALAKDSENSKDNKQNAPLELPRALSVRQLADLLGVTPVDIIKELMRRGIMANINQVVDYDTASAISAELGFETRPQPIAAQAASVISEIKRQQKTIGEAGSLKTRPPVVTIMGHVDHGKTRLLDAIRKANVMESEAGGITQHIGAYQVKLGEQKITFLDTPGHEAFTAMRARGARVTDITILVVAADDGVMPQTLEAIDHARAAGVPIIVAVNKIDKVGSNPDHVKKQLSEAGLLCEEWGGDTICVHTSAMSGEGIPELLENILLVAEMEELKADANLLARGVVVEARLDKNRGPMATVLVHDGSLRLEDNIAAGTTWGRVRAMFDSTGRRMRRANPSTPVAVLGLHDIPEVGDPVVAFNSEQEARAFVQRKTQERQTQTVNLSSVFEQIEEGEVKELAVALKVDVQGSLEPVKNSLEKLSTEKVRVTIIRSGAGNVTESDVMLAVASKGLIIAFNTGIEAGAQKLADSENIDIRSYRIIYEMIEDVEKALKGLLAPQIIEVVEGVCEVRAVFPSGKKSKVAGVYVVEGTVTRDAMARVKRGDKVVAQSPITGLKRFKDDVRNVPAGYECGVDLKDFNAFQVGDIIEVVRKQKARQA
jgi:translation initiation factor IF-2